MASLVPFFVASNANAEVASQLDYYRHASAAHCPDEHALRRAVEQRMGYDPFVGWAPRRVVVEVTPIEPGALRATLKLVESHGIISGQRQLESSADECDELVAVVALAISITLDPEAVARVAGSQPAEAAEVTSETDAAAAAADPEPTTPKSRLVSGSLAAEDFTSAAHTAVDPYVPFARASILASIGTEPQPSAGVRGGGGLRRGAVAALLDVRVDLPRTTDDGAARSGLIAGSVLPCGIYAWLWGCAELLVGWLNASGEGITDGQTKHVLVAGAGLRLETRIRLTERWDFVTSAGGLFMLTPVTLRLREVDVWRTPVVSGDAGIGVSAAFP